MGVATYRKCPEGWGDQMVWIENFEKCSESSKCLRSACRYKKPEQKKERR